MAALLEFLEELVELPFNQDLRGASKSYRSAGLFQITGDPYLIKAASKVALFPNCSLNSVRSSICQPTLCHTLCVLLSSFLYFCTKTSTSVTTSRHPLITVVRRSSLALGNLVCERFSSASRRTACRERSSEETFLKLPDASLQCLYICHASVHREVIAPIGMVSAMVGYSVEWCDQSRYGVKAWIVASSPTHV